MEIFIEEIVQRKKTGAELLIVPVLALVSTVLAVLVLFVVLPLIPQLGSILFLLVAAIFYGAYRLAMSFNLEFEYSLVNHEIDVDKIMNRARRKRLTTADIKGLEAFGTRGGSCEYDRYVSDFAVKKVFACRNKKSENNYFIVYIEDGMKKMLVFNPSEEIIDVIKKFNPKR